MRIRRGLVRLGQMAAWPWLRQAHRSQERFRELLASLDKGDLTPDEVVQTFLAIAKPYDAAKITAAKDIVARYLHHSDYWVRHEAAWFLTSWGRLREYTPDLLRMMRDDPHLDNRSFAAQCLSHLCRGTRDPEVIEALARAVLEESSDSTFDDESCGELLKLSAYGALLMVTNKSADPIFWLHDKTLSDIDWEWVRSIPLRKIAAHSERSGVASCADADRRERLDHPG